MFQREGPAYQPLGFQEGFLRVSLGIVSPLPQWNLRNDRTNQPVLIKTTIALSSGRVCLERV